MSARPSPVRPPLDGRLLAAAHFIRAPLHADIGSDHAALPIHLLAGGRAERLIVVEKTSAPLEVARRALAQAGLQARTDLRLGDGLEPLLPGELQSVSLTGMGQRTMLGILHRGAVSGREPQALVLQPNDGAGLLRHWAAGHSYWLTGEQLAAGFWRYPVVRLERRGGPDPAYLGLPEDAAYHYGPHLLRQAHPLLLEELRAQRTRLVGLERHGRPGVLRDLATVHSALAWLQQAERVPGQRAPQDG